jgi:PAS domain S-box-containing protein
MRSVNDLLAGVQILEAVPQGTLLVDPEGRQLAVNSVFAAVWRLPDRSGVQGTPLATFWKDPAAAEELLERLRGQEGPLAGEMRGRRSDGVAFGCRYTAAPVREGGGPLLGYLFTFPGAPQPAGGVHGNAHGSAVGGLAARERRGTIENLQDAYFWIDIQGRILRTNPAAARMYGYDSVEDLLGRPAAILYASPEDRFRLLEELETGGGVRDWVVPGRRRNGTTFLASLEIHPVHDEHGRTAGIEGFVRDVTERIRAEEAHNASIRRLEKELDHLQRLESLGQLASGVSHDMNNILATIMGVASILELRCPDDPDIVRDAQALLRAAGRGRDLVKGLRDFSRKELDSPRLLDLNELVRMEGELLERTTVKKVAVLLDLAEGLAPVFGEAGTIANAILNLGVNARDAMPGGGRLTLGTRNLGSGYVELTVQDDGEGMAPEVLARALEPFFTTKPAGKGTGLGLSQVYGTMKAHGGSLHIDSSPGAGTRVAMIFPPAVDVLDPAMEQPQPEGRPPLRILLVDDEPMLLAAVASMLAVLGHEVETACDGRECLCKLAAGAPPDLVILDNNMPVMDGVEALARIRETLPRLPVLFTTGSSDERVPPLLERLPELRLLNKPFSVHELRQALAEWPPVAATPAEA